MKSPLVHFAVSHFFFSAPLWPSSYPFSFFISSLPVLNSVLPLLPWLTFEAPCVSTALTFRNF
jgi:hypothetical protein